MGRKLVDAGMDTAGKAEHVWLGQVMVSRRMLGLGVMDVLSVGTLLNRFAQRFERALVGERVIVVAAVVG